MALWISIHLTKYLSLFTCSPCSLVLEDLNEALWISIHLTKYLSLVIRSVDLSDFEWIFLILYSIMKFLIFSSSFGSGQILCNKFLNPPNWYTLDCIDFLCKFGQFSCTFPIKHTGWVCSHGFCSCKSAGQIFEMGEHEKRAWAPEAEVLVGSCPPSDFVKPSQNKKCRKIFYLLSSL